MKNGNERVNIDHARARGEQEKSKNSRHRIGNDRHTADVSLCPTCRKCS